MSFSEHLGSRLGELVAGELTRDDRDRALAHLAGCAQCRALVEAERALKSRLGTTRTPEPSADLMASLLSTPADPIPDAVNALAEAATPLLDVEGHLQRIMGDAYRPPSQDQPSAGRTAAQETSRPRLNSETPPKKFIVRCPACNGSGHVVPIGSRSRIGCRVCWERGRVSRIVADSWLWEHGAERTGSDETSSPSSL